MYVNLKLMKYPTCTGKMRLHAFGKCVLTVMSGNWSEIVVDTNKYLFDGSILP